MKTFLPVSYNIPFPFIPDEMRKTFLHELAVNGAKYVVLGSGLLPELMARPELPEIIGSEMRNEGLEFMDAHAPYGPHWDIGAPFESERPARMLRMKLAIELAAFFKVRTMTLHMGKLHEGMRAEERFANVCRSLEELLPFAESRGVTLCVENGFAYLGFPQNLLAVKKEFPTDALGFCFDAGHANMKFAPDPEKQAWEVDEEAFLDAMLPHMVNCHIHDNDGMHDKHDLPGRGCADWERIVSKLKKSPRLQVIQSEVNLRSNIVAVRELVGTFDKIFAENI